MRMTCECSFGGSTALIQVGQHPLLTDLLHLNESHIIDDKKLEHNTASSVLHFGLDS